MGLLGNEQDRKPLFRVWAKQKKKASKSPNPTITDIIHCIKLSSTEEWIIVEGKESVLLINAESKVGNDFWQFATQLSGNLKQLIMIPANNKLGADIEPLDGKFCNWTYDGNDGIVYNNFFDSTGGNKSDSPSLSKLTLEAMKKPVAL